MLSQELDVRRLLRLQGAEADVYVAWAQRARRLADWIAPAVNVDEQAAPARPSSQRVGQSRIPRVGGELGLEQMIGIAILRVWSARLRGA